MTKLPELLDALNKAGYIDDNIRCEDNKDVIKDYNEIILQFKGCFTRTVKVYKLLSRRHYIHDSDYEALGFINAYFYLLKDN